MSAYERGQDCGKHWATYEQASDAELRNLQNLRAGKSDEQWHAWFQMSEGDRPAFQRFVTVLKPEASITPREVSGFWQAAITFNSSLTPSVLRDGAFVRGFAEGALEVWGQAGAAGERGSETPDEDWLDEQGGPTTENDT